MADMEAGMGPFLGVLLQSRGWRTGTIGAVITLGAVVGMLAVTPAGALVDATSHKRVLHRCWSWCRRGRGGHPDVAALLGDRRGAGGDVHLRGNDRTRDYRHDPWRRWASKVHPSKRPQPGLQSRQRGAGSYQGPPVRQDAKCLGETPQNMRFRQQKRGYLRDQLLRRNGPRVVRKKGGPGGLLAPGGVRGPRLDPFSPPPRC